MNIPANVNAALRKFRKRTTWSRQVFATRLHISMVGLGNYETGRTMPIDVLIKLTALAHDLSDFEYRNYFWRAAQTRLPELQRMHWAMQQRPPARIEKEAS